MTSITLPDLVNPYTIAGAAIGLSNYAVWLAGNKVRWTPQRKVLLGIGAVLVVFLVGLALNPGAYIGPGHSPVQEGFIVLANAVLVLLSSMGAPIARDAALMAAGKFETPEPRRELPTGGMSSAYDIWGREAVVTQPARPRRWRTWTG